MRYPAWYFPFQCSLPCGSASTLLWMQQDAKKYFVRFYAFSYISSKIGILVLKSYFVRFSRFGRKIFFGFFDWYKQWNILSKQLAKVSTSTNGEVPLPIISWISTFSYNLYLDNPSSSIFFELFLIKHIVNIKSWQYNTIDIWLCCQQWNLTS